jgi:hypothetical protein
MKRCTVVLFRFGFLVAFGVGVAHAAEMPARPNSLPGCESATYESALKTGQAIVASHPNAVFTDYSGDESDKLLAVVNAFPPVTKYLAEHVLVVETPDDDDSHVMIGLVHNGCVIVSAIAPQGHWSALRRGAIGDAL